MIQLAIRLPVANTPVGVTALDVEVVDLGIRDVGGVAAVVADTGLLRCGDLLLGGCEWRTGVGNEVGTLVECLLNCRALVAAGRRDHDRAGTVEDRAPVEGVPGPGRARRRRLDDRGRYDPRPRRPERVGQVDADQDPRRLSPADRRRGHGDVLRQRPGRRTAGTRRRARRRARRGPVRAPGPRPRRGLDGSREPGARQWLHHEVRQDQLARRRGESSPSARGDRLRERRREDPGRCARSCAEDRRRSRPRTARMGSRRAPARARRADGVAARPRRPAPVRGDPATEGTWRRDSLRVAPPRRGVRDRRRGVGAA